jgi:hypothetical protein
MNKVNISQVDVLFANGIYHIEFLFYYKEGFNTGKIRHALRKLSSVFWPMFGEYRDGKILFDSYREEDCYDEEVLNQELNIPELEEKGFEAYSRFRLPDIKQLFFLKVIRLKNGMILIPKMNHLAGDGYSYFYFLSALAALSRPSLVPFKSSLISLFLKPHHRRTTLKDFSFEGAELKPVFQNNKFTVEFDEIPRKDVQSMIREVATSDNFQVSTNDILSAIAVKKIVNRKSQLFGDEVNLIIPIDVRRQIKEYGRVFFGNGIMLHTTKFKKNFIESSLAKGLAVQIRKSMPSVSKETYINYLTELEETISKGKMDRFQPFDPKGGCLVTNISRLPTERLNFGAGSPELILPLTVKENSTAILAKKENFILRFAHNP